MASIAVAPDTVVTLSYELLDEQGQTVDEAPASAPLTYVHGYAQIVPGLERALEGLRAGDRREVVVEPEDAFGEHDDSGVFEVERDDFPDAEQVKVGDEFVAEGPDGDAMSMRIVEVLPDAFVVDTNHPLAGQRVRFRIEVTDVRAASEEEILEARTELAERAEEHAGEHDGCCGHDHDHPGHEHGHEGGAHGHEGLVRLTRKPS